MKPGLTRLLPLLAAPVLLFAFAGFPAPAAGGADSAVYTMHREGLRVRLEVRDDEIVSTRVWARMRCSDGFEGGSRLSLRGQGQRVRISSSGRFHFRWITGNGYWRRIHLRGRVRPRTIVGTYMAWERESQSVVCGTGRPGDRTLRFTARR